MTNILKPRRTGTVLKVPTTSDLADGELGINYTDAKVYQRIGADVFEVANNVLPLKGKRIAFLGDSLTELYLDTVSIARNVGATGTRYGVRGTTMSAYPPAGNGVNVDKFSMYKLADAIATGSFTTQVTAANNWFAFDGTDVRPIAAAMAAQNWANIEYLVIMFGGNDWAGNLPLGTYTDTTGASYIGAINYTINTILAAYPNMQLVFIGPPYRNSSDTVPNSNTVYLRQFGDATVQTALAKGLPAFNAWSEGGVNQTNVATFTVDGVHPSTAGINRLTQVESTFLGYGSSTPNDMREVVYTTGTQLINGLKLFLNIILNTAPATRRMVSFWSNLSARWNIGANDVAESGANVGSNFIVERYSDAGVLLGTPVVIRRSNGVMELEARPLFNANTPWDSANLLVAAGTYTPTYTNTANAGTIANVAVRYSRIGTEVTVTGSFNVTPTAINTSTVVRMTLPIAASFANNNAVGGSGSAMAAAAAAHIAVSFRADSATSEVAMLAAFPVAGTYQVRFGFTYFI